ncbi:glycosyltransferase [Candidatus Magnetominusculus xianensis]|uniref:Glycosyl transferases group 1 n=1 Tax=Candidatus Magnetominusculus xianensis TaxID=1748249 RepID=A0ABR5SKM5_9BACT|nr:glycosyltransferase [Candidatus Magnetominusculus xianensis]KWT94650.1 glycosyl transferases group 1 [Candidatus Magnetominusculus xianensis]MBF0403362.1 glycosyltransferase family 4 protein [Nitrospirota bacterium]
MAAAPITVLRPDRQTGLVSAGFFTNDYARNLLPDIRIDYVPLTAWCDSVMGDIKDPYSAETASKRFEELTRGYDYFNPSYELTPFIPYILYLRNMSRADIRLMFTAHAPGCYSMEYVLMRLLLVDGDIIIAPSESGKKTIEFLCQGLSPVALPHPIHMLPTTSRKRNGGLATLSRIDPGKLIHRQVEAMPLLKTSLKMDIAGPLRDTQTGDYHQYALLLREKLINLRLKRTVRLHDTISGDDNKSRFLSRAQALLCLSVTIEEAYPKSAIEALGLGLPVIGTRWDGLPEVVGGCGRLIDIVNDVSGGVDAAPDKIAEAIDMLMDDMPSADQCKEQAQRFSPQRIRPLYREVLAQHKAKGISSGFDDIYAGKDICAAPEGGVLCATAPLLNLSWHELFSINLDEITCIRRYWMDNKVINASAGLNLRSMLLSGTQRQLEKFLSFNAADRYEKGHNEPLGEPSGGDFYQNIYNAVKSPATQTSKQICLNRLLMDGKEALFLNGLRELNGQMTSGLTYLTIEGEILKGNYEKAYSMCIEDISFREGDHFRVRQLAKVCRIMKQPERALPTIRQWLSCYPWSVHSAEIWLDRCINAAMTGKGYKKEAKSSFNTARRLLGSSDVLDKIEKGYLF